jgi:hypothetical protein
MPHPDPQPLTTEARQAALRALMAQGLTFSDVVDVFGDTPDSSPHLAYAREHCTREGELEVDERAVISDGADAGVYCMAWLWVSDEDAGVARDADGKVVAATTG